MERRTQKIGLDNPAFHGRLRKPVQRKRAEAHVVRRRALIGGDRSYIVHRATLSAPKSPPKKQDKPASTTERHIIPNHIGAVAIKSSRAKTQSTRTSIGKLFARVRLSSYFQPRFALQAMAVLIFVIGLSVSLHTELTNRQATAKVEALSQQTDGAAEVTGNRDVPSTNKPSAKAMNNYVVAPDLPRYITIPKLGVKARVLPMGVKADGALDTPRNVYDAGWYTGSAKPGGQGATVIDGHLSSWKTKGVFYGLKNLHTGDAIAITKGDNAVITYRVVQQKTYKADSVDMQKVITPISSGKSGLNIITCAGRVKPGTSDFTHRTVVFLEQI